MFEGHSIWRAGSKHEHEDHACSLASAVQPPAAAASPARHRDENDSVEIGSFQALEPCDEFERPGFAAAFEFLGDLPSQAAVLHGASSESRDDVVIK